jgi:hypothetical protein
MAERARHAFGKLSSIESAKQANKIDAFDILFLDGDTEPKVGWLDANGETKIVDTEKVVVVEGESLPEAGVEGKIYIFGEDGYFWNGTEFVNLCKPTDVTSLETQVNELGTEMKQKVDAATVQTMIEEHSESLIEVVEF